jgi:hypothetical protein
MCQEQVTRGTDLLAAQMRELIAGIAALVAAVHDKRGMAGLYIVAVALLAARITCQIELHEYLLFACASSRSVRDSERINIVYPKLIGQ